MSDVRGPRRSTLRGTRICFVGWGAIGQRTSRILFERSVPVEITAVAVRDAALARPDIPRGARLLVDPDELEGADVELVVEAAGRSTVLPWGSAALRMGADFAVSSTSALADDGVLEALRSNAEATRSRILVPPGALGGIDALAAASRLAVQAVTHRIVKPPQAWLGTNAERRCDLLNVTVPTIFFEGSARIAADEFPQNANVAVISSLAGVGLDRTRIALVADPSATRNVHEIHASGDFGDLHVRLENRPLVDNPRSSEMTALNLARLIENRTAWLVV